MTTLYWLLEYGKVLFAYVFIMFIWPSVVMRKYLRGKSITFRFGFCTTFQIIVINTVVLMIGLFHLLNPWVVRVLFYGTFMFSIFKNIRLKEEHWKRFKCLMAGTYGIKSFRRDILLKIKESIKRVTRNFAKTMYGHWWEYALLLAVVIYGMIYFSYGAFQDFSYGFGDLYPHNAWIYGLTKGQIFSAGVYPEGMHCFIYALHTLFGIRIYSCLLFTAGIHVAVFLVAAYVLIKEIFHWQYTPMLVLTLFLTLDMLCIDTVYSMSRLQWTLPQEFGLFTQFLCAAFLIRYLKGKRRLKYFGWDENLLVFMLALAASLAIHFYVTIMAFFLCVAFVPLAVHKIFHYKRLLPLMAAVISGFMIAVLPMAGALASGIPFQGSIGWAMNVINGTDSSVSNTTMEEQGIEESVDNVLMDQETVMEEEVVQDSVTSIEGAVTEEKEVDLQEVAEGSIAFISKKLKAVYTQTYGLLYNERAITLIFVTVLVLASWFIYKVIVGALQLFVKKRKIDWNCFDHYFSITLASIIFIFMYDPRSVGLPYLVAGSRLCSTAQLLILAVVMIPIDVIFTTLAFVAAKGLMKVCAAAGVLGIYLGTMLTGTFHGYLYYELTRHNGAVMSTYAITNTLPKDSFTIVSTVDELYQVIQYGFHEEITTFVNESAKNDYMLPTEYVFLYVEKAPIQYGQKHFFTGPKWLAWEKYPQYYEAEASQCPDILVSEISKEKAQLQRSNFVEAASSYSNIETRTILEANVYEWCKKFEEIYPNELHTYYEDEYMICYYFKQNLLSLHQLAID